MTRSKVQSKNKDKAPIRNWCCPHAPQPPPLQCDFCDGANEEAVYLAASLNNPILGNGSKPSWMRRKATNKLTTDRPTKTKRAQPDEVI